MSDTFAPDELAARCTRAMVDPAKVDDLGYLLFKFGEHFAAANVAETDDTVDRYEAASDLICDLVDRKQAEIEHLRRELEAQRRDHGRDLWRAAQQLTRGGEPR